MQPAVGMGGGISVIMHSVAGISEGRSLHPPCVVETVGGDAHDATDVAMGERLEVL